MTDRDAPTPRLTEMRAVFLNTATDMREKCSAAAQMVATNPRGFDRHSHMILVNLSNVFRAFEFTFMAWTSDVPLVNKAAQQSSFAHANEAAWSMLEAMGIKR